jgi:hypothetical protein
MKFKNTSEEKIRLRGYGWLLPGDTVEVPADDEATNATLRLHPSFEKLTPEKKASATTKAKKATS